MKNKLKVMPSFSSEEEERLFWEQHDSAGYLDWDKAQQVVMQNLKPSTKTITFLELTF